ncbi:hypothetical protein AB0O33_13830, partial [Streptomyces sp. NPDC089795]
MNTPLPPAEELALIDRELAQLDARRVYLLGRRDWLLRLLLQPGSGPAPVRWGPAVSAGPAGPAREASAPSAQNVLLTLGAVLLAVAALAFTLVSWGSMGPITQVSSAPDQSVTDRYTMWAAAESMWRERPA